MKTCGSIQAQLFTPRVVDSGWIVYTQSNKRAVSAKTPAVIVHNSAYAALELGMILDMCGSEILISKAGCFSYFFSLPGHAYVGLPTSLPLSDLPWEQNQAERPRLPAAPPMSQITLVYVGRATTAFAGADKQCDVAFR